MEKVEGMYEKIKILLDEKIKEMSNKELTFDEKNLLTRLLKIKELMDDESNNLFDNISLDIAYKVLLDIGVEESKLREVYLKIIKESKKKYILVDPNNFKKNI